jgi:hypothetical protein
MKMNQWTLGLAALGLVSLTSAQAEEAKLSSLGTALSATTISGYVDTSAVWNPGSGNGNPAPYAFNNKHDGFNVDLVDLKLEKLIDPSVPWSAGYTVDTLWGPDANTVTSGGNSSFDEHLRQAYVDLSIPVGNMPDIKVGRFDTILGYESTDAYNNPNWTHSYGYTLEPTEHTGVLAHYKVFEPLTVDAGVANTVDTGTINQRTTRGGRSESHMSYLGRVTLTAPDSWGFLAKDALVAAVAHGSGPTDMDKTHVYAGANINTPLKDLVFGVGYDAVFHSDVYNSTTDRYDDTGFATAVAGYVSYKLTEKLTTAVRVDYGKGRIFGASTANSPDLDKLLGLTGTISYDLWANVLTRLEVRWDHAIDSSRPFGDGPNSKSEVMIAANLVYKF